MNIRYIPKLILAGFLGLALAATTAYARPSSEDINTYKQGIIVSIDAAESSLGCEQLSKTELKTEEQINSATICAQVFEASKQAYEDISAIEAGQDIDIATASKNIAEQLEFITPIYYEKALNLLNSNKSSIDSQIDVYSNKLNETSAEISNNVYDTETRVLQNIEDLNADSFDCNSHVSESYSNSLTKVNNASMKLTAYIDDLEDKATAPLEAKQKEIETLISDVKTQYAALSDLSEVSDLEKVQSYLSFYQAIIDANTSITNTKPAIYSADEFQTLCTAQADVAVSSFNKAYSDFNTVVQNCERTK